MTRWCCLSDGDGIVRDMTRFNETFFQGRRIFERRGITPRGRWGLGPFRGFQEPVLNGCELIDNSMLMSTRRTPFWDAVWRCKKVWVCRD